MNRASVYEYFEKNKLAAVLRGGKDDVLKTADRLVLGGVRILEVTFTVRGADDVIKELRTRYNCGARDDVEVNNCGGGAERLGIVSRIDKANNTVADNGCGTDNGGVIVGAGTVLDAETARAAILAGAEFVVSPAASAEVVKLCNRYSAAVFPGIATATELLSVLEYGADFVKLFPADIAVLKALRAPFPNVKFMVTGGVSLRNLDDWFAAGASACGAGSNLTASSDAEKWIKKITAAGIKKRA
ncbi:MAG: bifunctional 2-keto-4-hydroxyglutarate aldolase/2-keto-3-deoxy-6-phosphogluconate aldolase [Clostridiales bacterium]|jgi:2-dehydro-3-deoxyphosphogluconate aldolase/(4S)-4-hydroxy-2-oxoglutarate aldolase|nr:bifunctional 2-keto-4-hydroxyglutarate aldolase/2-keto-3-deoxy-6-phosphogluconate aldolase [Clostridiales bacterium]